MALDLTFNGLNVTAASYTSDLTLTLSKEEVSYGNAAPAAVWFHVSNVQGADAGDPGAGETYDPKYHEIVYIWDFGDTQGMYLADTVNIPQRWKDTNTAYGRRVAHSFNDPGVYTVRCTAYEPATGRKGTQTVTVNVADPDVVYPANLTWVYAPEGTSGAPIPTGAQVRTNWADIFSHIVNTQGATDPLRVLMAPGAEVEVGIVGSTSDYITLGADRGAALMIAPLDPTHPDRPRFRSLGSRRPIDRGTPGANPWSMLCLYGIDFVGSGDSTREKGGRTSLMRLRAEGNLRRLVHMHRCTVSGYATVQPWLSPTVGMDLYFMMSDTFLTNWVSYGFYSPGASAGNGSHVAIIGSALSQHPDALSGGERNNLHNDGAALRDGGSRMFISGSELFSRQGWFPNGLTYKGNRIVTEQPAARINFDALPDCETYFDRVVCEGDVQVHHQNVNEFTPGNHIFDKVLSSTGPGAQVSPPFGIQFGGTTLRNVLMVRWGVPRIFEQKEFIKANAGGDAVNEAAGLRIHNVTAVDLRDDVQAAGDAVTLINVVGFNHVSENNVLHMPHQAGNPPVASGIPLDLEAVFDGFHPRHKGPRPGFNITAVTLSDTVSGSGGTLSVPYTAFKDMTYTSDSAQLASAPGTTQAYWQANEATDTRHRVWYPWEVREARLGEISVSFTDSANVVIANNTGSDWAVGNTIFVDLDRTSRLPAFDPAYGVHTVTPGVVGTTDQESNAAPATSLIAYDDLTGSPRPSVGARRGAL